MSSASQVQIISVPEVDYGVTPQLTAGAATVRFVSESLSGTPTTTESAELRSDRMSGGQVVVGLESGGDINFELSKNDLYSAFMSMAMMSDWVPAAVPADDITSLTKDPTNDQLATIVWAGDTADIDGNGRPLQVGDVIILEGFTNPANNGPVQVTQIVSATDFVVAVPRLATDETPVAGGSMEVPSYIDIGAAIKSVTLSKSYLDVLHDDNAAEEHSQRYTGSIVNRLALNLAYGEIVTGTFGFLSNGYLQEAPSLRQQIITAGGTVAPAGTEQPMNGSVDMPMVTVDGMPTDFCIQTMSLDMSNNATPQNCLGKIAPNRYNLGTVSIGINTSIYLADPSYDRFMPAKLSQTPISFLFAAENEDGGYAFDLRAVQLSFPDPSASGGDSPVLIEASGTAKVGPGGTSALRIWSW